MTFVAQYFNIVKHVIVVETCAKYRQIDRKMDIITNRAAITAKNITECNKIGKQSRCKSRIVTLSFLGLELGGDIQC